MFEKEKRVRLPHPPGHFYSPIVDPDEINESRTWPPTPDVLGIDFNDIGHKRMLDEVFPRHIGDYAYPERLEETAELTTFYTQNSQFSWLDSRALFVFVREWKPRRFLEVGSGFSTLLVADINRRWFDNAMTLTCVEPYPREFLKRGIPGVTRLVEEKVQEVPLTEFENLQDGDILFIDSSHVAKTDSDVNYLYFEVLPRLASGVRIHVHDIFLPHEYPREWVIDENRSWNEQYILRALLMYSQAFRIEFGCNYAWSRFPDEVRAALANGHGYGGGSIWLRRI
jgi:hypothetical protein